jgi:hypothetical protein
LIIARQYQRLADRYDRIEKSLMRAPILLV